MLERFDKPVVTLGVNSSFTVFCIPFIFASVLLIAFVRFSDPAEAILFTSI